MDRSAFTIKADQGAPNGGFLAGECNLKLHVIGAEWGETLKTEGSGPGADALLVGFRDNPEELAKVVKTARARFARGAELVRQKSSKKLNRGMPNRRVKSSAMTRLIAL